MSIVASALVALLALSSHALVTPYTISPKAIDGVWGRPPFLGSTKEPGETSSTLPVIQLFNSKSLSKEPLRPLEGRKVKFYSCGPTVYDQAHIGNFRALLMYDLVKRVLLYFGYEVFHVCNLTDVDDKIIQRANERGVRSISDLTSKYENQFFKDLEALNVKPADVYPRATENIKEMMDLILELAGKGFAYETEDGSWYFATDMMAGYGSQLVKLDGGSTTDSRQGESGLKRNPRDFCLWKAFKSSRDRDDASWESADIRKGRPGWHLECSAMARKYLGDQIDLHAGGIDLKFPHHENEIAQSEGATGKTFCRCWLHNGFVNIDNKKMSKSDGNALTLNHVCTHPEEIRALRYLMISAHYRSPLTFTSQALGAARHSVERVEKLMGQLETALSNSDVPSTNYSALANDTVPVALNTFETALLDDLSTPSATASLFSLVRAAEEEMRRHAKNPNTALDVLGLNAVSDALQRMDKVFGIFYDVHGAAGKPKSPRQQVLLAVPDNVAELVVERTRAREAKDWALADSIRGIIAALGYTVNDSNGGNTTVTRVS